MKNILFIILLFLLVGCEKIYFKEDPSNTPENNFDADRDRRADRRRSADAHRRGAGGGTRRASPRRSMTVPPRPSRMPSSRSSTSSASLETDPSLARRSCASCVSCCGARWATSGVHQPAAPAAARPARAGRRHHRYGRAHARAHGSDDLDRAGGVRCDLDDGSATVALRIAQEALQNVRKHAAASTVEVTTGIVEGGWVLRDPR